MSEDWSGWIPILPVADAQRSLRFYCDLLGFTQDWEHRFEEGFPLYVQVSRGTVILHLSEHGDPGQSASHCIGVRDVDATYAEFTGRGLKTNGPPEDRAYGVRDFSFNDPDGHHLVFATQLNWFDEAAGARALKAATAP